MFPKSFERKVADNSHDMPPEPEAVLSLQSQPVKSKSSFSNNGLFYRLMYSTLPRCKARVGMQMLMAALAFFGCLGALAHHLYYQHLHGQQVEDPQWPTRGGIALSFFVKIALVASVEIAYKQQAWVILQRHDFKVSTIDSIFTVCNDPRAFTNAEMVQKAFLAATMAALVWLLPLCAIASPSTLTSRDTDLSRIETCNKVPTFNLARENRYGIHTEDDDGRAGMSYWEFRDDGLYSYSEASQELKRIFRLAMLSITGPLKPPSPCPLSRTCTYSLSLDAPTYRCEDRQEFGGKNPQKYKRSQLAPNGPLYFASYSSFEEDGDGQPLAWSNISLSSRGKGVFTEIPSLWVGWVTDFDDYFHGHMSHITECFLYDATLTYEFTFSGDNMTIKQTSATINDLLLSPGSSKAPWDEDYQQFAGNHAAGFLFRQFLSGNITYNLEEDLFDTTGEILQSNLIGSAAPEPISDDLGHELEKRFDDLFLSIISDTQLHSQIHVPISCSVTESVLVWNYEPFWLVLSYGTAVSLTIVAIAIGGYSFYTNGYSIDTKFSTIVATTRSPDLDKLTEGHCLGEWPMSKDVLDSRLRFGELSNKPTRGRAHAAFGFPCHVRKVQAGKEYL